MDTGNAVTVGSVYPVEGDAQGSDPVEDFHFGVFDVVAHPSWVIVHAPLGEIRVCKIRRILNALGALKWRVDDVEFAFGHDGVTAEDRGFIDDQYFGAGPPGFESGGEACETGANDDQIGVGDGIWVRRRLFGLCESSKGLEG